MKIYTYSAILLIIALAYFAQAGAANTDLRVLIDVSGSMKKNDPNNLRIPALRLLTNLLPEKSQAGIWLFEKNTKVLVKPQITNNAWKKQAQNLTANIHSRGKFTDIETAIKTALKNWSRNDELYQRHLILLSDGMIDINGKQSASKQSRQRIINNLLPELKHNQIRVHTVALSANADHQLLKLLSRETNGWYERIETSAELNRTFLKLFENTTQTDKVPLKNNQFNIDSSISDMTLLVFRDSNSPITQLISPQQERWNYKSKPANVKWFQTEHYELITVSKPKQGKWHLQANIDPDNRVMVVTNLKLKSNNLSKHLLAGDQINLHTWLEQENQHLNNSKLLALVKFKIQNIEQQKSANKTQAINISDDGENGDLKENDGIYHSNLSGLEKAGDYTVKITATSPTFSRMLIKNFRIHADPIRVRILELPATAESIIQAMPTPGLFKQQSLLMQLEFSDGNKIAMHKNQLGLFEHKIPKHYNGQTLKLKLHGQRSNLSKAKIEMQYVLPSYKKEHSPEPITELPIKTAITPKATNKVTEHHKKIKNAKHVHKSSLQAHDKKNEHKHIHKDEHKNHKPNNDHKKSEEKDKSKQKKPSKNSQKMLASVNWTVVISAVLLGNILIIGAAVFFYKRRKKQAANLDEDLDLDAGE